MTQSHAVEVRSLASVLRIEVPAVHLDSCPGSLDGLCERLEPAWQCAGLVQLDLSRCNFISAEGVALLAALKLFRDHCGRSTYIDWSDVPPAVSKQLGRWDVATLLDGPAYPSRDGAIPLLHAPQWNQDRVRTYVQNEIIAHNDMPAMEPPIAKTTRRSFCEVIQNVFRHAESPIGAIAIGQMYPRAQELQICICDIGVGMVQRVRAGSGEAFTTAGAAIDWALQPGTTTYRGGDMPAGMGLYLLREIVKLNGGKFRIYANDGFYSEMWGTPSKQTLKGGFPGTLLELRLNTRGRDPISLESITPEELYDA